MNSCCGTESEAGQAGGPTHAGRLQNRGSSCGSVVSRALGGLNGLESTPSPPWPALAAATRRPRRRSGRGWASPRQRRGIDSWGSSVEMSRFSPHSSGWHPRVRMRGSVHGLMTGSLRHAAPPPSASTLNQSPRQRRGLLRAYLRLSTRSETGELTCRISATSNVHCRQKQEKLGDSYRRRPDCTVEWKNRAGNRETEVSAGLCAGHITV